MTLEDIYNVVQNPLTPEKLPVLFQEIAENTNVYNALIGGGNTEKVYRNNDKELHVKLAERWRQELASLTETEIEEKEQRVKNFSTLPLNCRNLPQINNYETAMKLLKQIPHQYAWTFKENNWEYFQSTELVGNAKEIEENMRTRIYINCSLDNIGDFIEEIMDRCKIANLPIYLKTLMFDTKRKDRILLWVDSKNLVGYIEVLKEILADNPSWEMEDPPILTGKILNGIGIASEPNESNLRNNTFGEKHSFNSLRAPIILETTEQMLKKAFNQIPLEKPYNVSNEFFRFLSEEISKGLRIYGITRPSKDIYDSMTGDATTLNMIVQKTKNIDTERAKLLADSIEYDFSQDIKKAMKRCLPYIENDLKGFNQGYLNELKKRLQLQGLDPEKICFNSDTLDELKRIDLANSNLEDKRQYNV